MPLGHLRTSREAYEDALQPGRDIDAHEYLLEAERLARIETAEALTRIVAELERISFHTIATPDLG